MNASLLLKKSFVPVPLSIRSWEPQPMSKSTVPSIVEKALVSPRSVCDPGGLTAGWDRKGDKERSQSGTPAWSFGGGFPTRCSRILFEKKWLNEIGSIWKLRCFEIRHQPKAERCSDDRLQKMEANCSHGHISHAGLWVLECSALVFLCAVHIPRIYFGNEDWI